MTYFNYNLLLLLYASRKTLHQNLSEYFIGTWSGRKKPFHDKEGNFGDAERFISTQPNVFSEDNADDTVVFNHRKLNELPYHLVRAEQIETLKSSVLLNLDWLYNKLRAFGFDSVMDDFLLAEDEGIVDEEILLVKATLELSKSGIMYDYKQLPLQISARLLCLNLANYPNIVRLVETCQNPPFTCLVTLKGKLSKIISIFLQSIIENFEKN